MVQIVNASEEEFIHYIDCNKSNLYVWGTGVMLQICFYNMLLTHHLQKNVVSFTESDQYKVGKFLYWGDDKIPIVDFQMMIEKISGDKNAFIVIACSYYYEILCKLDKEKDLNNVKCLLLPMLYLENKKKDQISLESPKKLIPKKIHYCWFGGNPLPEKNLKCIESWKKQCPDYEIIRWDETNTDICMSAWVKRAYTDRQWAYVSDYVRAWVLYQYGGYYFDTDVELIKNLDDLSGMTSFGCFEKWPVINTGGGCGSVPSFWLWKEIMDLKNEIINSSADGVLPAASGYYDTLPLIKKGMKVNGRLQTIQGFTCLPFEYFQPVDYISRRKEMTSNTYGIHYFNWSWADNTMQKGNPSKVDYYAASLKRAKRISSL